MDIDSRNFVDVMKDLSNQTGIELPKDNHDNKKLSYKRSPQQIAAAQPTNTPVAENPAPISVADEFIDGHFVDIDRMMNKFKKVISMTYWKALLSFMNANSQ